MTIDAATGAFSWTPSELQGGTAYTVTVTVSDNGTNPSSLSATRQFTITVNEVNVAPVLAAIADQTVNEQATLSFTVPAATDQDDPVQTLSYSLDAASVAAGMTIDAATGAFSWTPSELQGGAAYTVTVTVTDGSLSATRQFTITVNEVNVAPVLAAIADQTVNEQATLSFTVPAATDQDDPVQTLQYSLDRGLGGGGDDDRRGNGRV